MKHLALFMFIGLNLAGQAWGQGGETEVEKQDLTLERAIEIALEKHPRLRLVDSEVGSAESRLRQARSTLFPQIGVGGLAKQGLSGAANLFGLEGLAASPFPDDLAASANVYQDLFDSGRTKYEREARRFELQSISEAACADRDLLVLEVTKAYYNALKSRKLVAGAWRLLEEKQLFSHQTELFSKAGLGSALDVELAAAEVARAHLQLTRSESDRADALASSYARKLCTDS